MDTNTRIIIVTRRERMTKGFLSRPVTVNQGAPWSPAGTLAYDPDAGGITANRQAASMESRDGLQGHHATRLGLPGSPFRWPASIIE